MRRHTELAAFRLPSTLLNALTDRARLCSIQAGKNAAVSSLVRLAIERLLAGSVPLDQAVEES
jgi:hypothetical protein